MFIYVRDFDIIDVSNLIVVFKKNKNPPEHAMVFCNVIEINFDKKKRQT